MPPSAATWFEPSKRIGTWKLITPIERELAAPLWAAHDETRVAYVRHFRVRSLKAGVRLDKVISWASGYEHANILPIFGVMDVEGGAGVAVISHYEEGQPLASVLQKEHLTRNRMPTPVAVAIALDLLEALHATGGRLAPAWSHGGLRPESILVTRGGRARIMELGATSVLAAVEPLSREPRWAAFGSPEQLEGTPGATSDVFTVATLLWEMLADRPLFNGRTFEEIKRKLRDGRVERLDKLSGVPVPAKMADVVATALAVSPKERFETPKAFGTALRRTAGAVAERHEVSEYLEQLHRVALNNRRRTLTQALGKPAPVSLPPAPSKGTSKIPAAPRMPSFGVDVSQSFLPPSLKAAHSSKPPGLAAPPARTPMPSKPPPTEAPRIRPRTPLPSGPPDVALGRSGNAQRGANAEPAPVTLATPAAPAPEPTPRRDTPPPDSPDEPDFSAFIEDDSAIESLADEREDREDLVPLAEQLEPDVTAPSEGIPVDVSMPGAMPSIDVEMSMPGANPSAASVDVDVSLPGVVTSDTPSEPPDEADEPPTQMMEPRAEAEAAVEPRPEPTPRPISEHPATTLTKTQRTAVYTPPPGAMSDDDVMLRPRRRFSTLVIGMIVGALVAFGAAYAILREKPPPPPAPTAEPEPAPPPPPEPKPEPAKEPTAAPSASAPAPKTKPAPRPVPVVRPAPRPGPAAPAPEPKEQPPPPPPPADPDVYE